MEAHSQKTPHERGKRKRVTSSIRTDVTDATTRTFGYTDPNFPNALTSEIDETGTTYATWTYDAQERGKTSSLALGAGAVSLDYNGNSTTVTDVLGATRTFTFGRSGDRVPVTNISGDPCHNCADAAATTYDASGWVASRTDYDGDVTCYFNDQTRGLELIRIEGFAAGSACPTDLAGYTPAAGTTQRKISTTWHTVYRLPTLITESTRSTSLGYDSTGNLLTKTVTDTTASPNVSRTWTYTNNGFGQVLTVQGPRTDLNSTRTYTYYTCTTGTQCGQVHTVTDELGHVTTFNSYNALWTAADRHRPERCSHDPHLRCAPAHHFPLHCRRGNQRHVLPHGPGQEGHPTGRQLPAIRLRCRTPLDRIH